MQFALPPRRSAAPPGAHSRSPRPATGFTVRRGSRLKPYALPFGIFAALLLLIYIFTHSAGAPRIPPGTPPVVIVTVIDKSYGAKYENMIKQNRRAYASRHGYTTFFPETTDYNLTIPNAGLLPDTTPPPVPQSWSQIPALRHALKLFPHSTWFFYLDHRALLMRPDIPLDAHITSPERLRNLMITDVPVVPPESVIHTLSSRNPSRVDLILTQDHDGLSQHALLLRNGDWARFFLDAWFDPLYRAYNFQRAEGHALEHLVQWHGTVLTRLALVPQRAMNAYVRGTGDEKYGEGDFVAHAIGCDWPGRSCEKEVFPLYEHVASLG